METGIDSIERIPFDLVAFVQKVCEPYAAQAEQADIELALQLPDEEIVICGNQKLLQHALGNLLDNAQKFTPAGGTVTLSVRKNENWACMQVSDTGIGIMPEDLPRLFERFHRGQNAASHPGSGLGLAIVKAITLSHNGRVTAENNPDGGACFTLCLPLYAV